MRHTNNPPPLIIRLLEGVLWGLIGTVGFGILGLIALLLWVFLFS